MHQVVRPENLLAGFFVPDDLGDVGAEVSAGPGINPYHLKCGPTPPEPRGETIR